MPRKCLHCKEFFLSDYRNRRHQKYCFSETCQRESHRRAQAKYRASPKGKNCDTTEDVAARVRKSRARRREARVAEEAMLRDDCKSERVAAQDDGICLGVLRDDCLEQDPLIIGLISHVLGELRDDIATTVKTLQSRGQMILGKGPGIATQN